MNATICSDYNILYNSLLDKNVKLSVIGLGYVGLPVAVAFSQKLDVIGFDLNESKINAYKSGFDPTGEVGDDLIAACDVDFTTDERRLREARFHIVAVPTPVASNNIPDLRAVEGSAEVLGRNLTRSSVVVFESTVYPGVTEEIFVPIIERESGLKCGVDFKVGYSPERINPGDKERRLADIVKVVSGMDAQTLEIVAKIYELVIDAGVYRAESIKVAEAAKVIENSQRDINIAFMNELSIIFNKMDIDTKAVLEAAGTKWNFLNFYPGLVGGHCIGVDPYYLTYKARQLGYRCQIITAGRRINDSMGKYVTENLVKTIIKADKSVKNARIAIFGLTFKENCPDIRNTRIIDIYNELCEYGIKPIVVDPVANSDEVVLEYGIELSKLCDVKELDALVLAVAHDEFKALDTATINNLFKTSETSRILFDLKGMLSRKEFELANYIYWRL